MTRTAARRTDGAVVVAEFAQPDARFDVRPALEVIEHVEPLGRVGVVKAPADFETLRRQFVGRSATPPRTPCAPRGPRRGAAAAGAWPGPRLRSGRPQRQQGRPPHLGGRVLEQRRHLVHHVHARMHGQLHGAQAVGRRLVVQGVSSAARGRPSAFRRILAVIQRGGAKIKRGGVYVRLGAVGRRRDQADAGAARGRRRAGGVRAEPAAGRFQNGPPAGRAEIGKSLGHAARQGGGAGVVRTPLARPPLQGRAGVAAGARRHSGVSQASTAGSASSPSPATRSAQSARSWSVARARQRRRSTTASSGVRSTQTAGRRRPTAAPRRPDRRGSVLRIFCERGHGASFGRAGGSS